MMRSHRADEPLVFRKSGAPWFIALTALCGACAATAATAASPEVPSDPVTTDVQQDNNQRKETRTSLLAAQVARGRAAWEERDLVSALAAFDQALTLDPGSVAAREGRLLVVSRLGSPTDAIEEARHYPELGAGFIQYLHEEEAALAIRWSENVYHAKASGHYPESDRAIALVQSNLARYPGSERSRFDLVRALNNRQRSKDAVAAYEALQRDGLAIPGYVHEAAGAAYFAEKKPEQSERAYRTALTADPGSLEANVGLFYALSDQNDFATAQKHIDRFAAQPKKPVAQFVATTAAIDQRAFENRLEIAQSNFLALQAEAPHSTELHVALGRVYLWRGWPRLAREELDLALQRDPDDNRANNARVEVDTALGDYEAASLRLAQSQAVTPDDHDARNLVRREAVRNLNELSVAVSGTNSNDNVGKGDGYAIDTKVYAAPRGFQTRPYVHAYYEHATIDTITADYQRLGAGVEHVIAGVGTVEAEVQQEFYLNNDGNLMVGGKFDLNDYWQVNARFDSNAIEVPLRARFDRISGWNAEVGASYRAHERIEASASVTEMQMSDKNIRKSVTAGATTHVVQGPIYNGSLGVELSASSNTEINTAYFNPKSDHTEQISYTSEWINYQRYDRSFKQTLVLSVGSYTEEGFSTEQISSISYAHDVQLSDVARLRYGVGYATRWYSGVESSGPEANLSFVWRF